MKSKVPERTRAIELRRRGFSYRDILQEVRVAKSTLSRWLMDLPLTEDEKRYLKTRNDANISRGRIKAATAHRSNRLARDEALRSVAETEFETHRLDPLFVIGVALYWAEGAKRSDTFHFMNSDVDMVKVMLAWLEKFPGIGRHELRYRLYIHKPYEFERCEEYWSEKANIPRDRFVKTIYKSTSLLVKKRPNYKGCLRIEVPKSTQLLRKMILWHHMLARSFS